MSEYDGRQFVGIDLHRRTIEEVASGAWGIGEQPLTTADVKALGAGAPVG